MSFHTERRRSFYKVVAIKGPTLSTLGKFPMSAQFKNSNSLNSADRHPPLADRFGVPMAEVVKSYEPGALHKIRSQDRPAAAQRLESIAVAAYYLSEKNGFDSAYDVENWLRAQADIDTRR